MSVRRHGHLQTMKHALIIIFAVSSLLAAFASSGRGADNANSTSKQIVRTDVAAKRRCHCSTSSTPFLLSTVLILLETPD